MSADVFNKLLELFTILHDIWQRQQRLCGENIPLPQIYANTAPTGCEEWGGEMVLTSLTLLIMLFNN